jgi:transcriptional regulator GlxA family with amidase domain
LELDGDATVSWYDTPRLRGWGFDDTSRARFADAAFLVDGSVISCSYGLGRPDVARAFSLHDADVGLEADVLLDFLPEGTHEVRAVALSGDGATVISEGSRLITVRSDERARRPRTAHLAR